MRFLFKSGYSSKSNFMTKLNCCLIRVNIWTRKVSKYEEHPETPETPKTPHTVLKTNNRAVGQQLVCENLKVSL